MWRWAILLVLYYSSLAVSADSYRGWRVQHRSKGGPSPPPYDTKYLEQEVDHFNFANHMKWSQRYLMSSKQCTEPLPHCAVKSSIVAM